MLLFWVLLIFVVANPSKAAETIEVQDKDEHELFVETKTSKEYLIKLPFSFKLIVTVEEVDVKSEYGDYLLIKKGPDFSSEGTALLLTEKGIPKDTVLISADSIYIQLFLGNAKAGEDNKRKFKLKYKASGTSKVTTTEAPISTSTFPRPGPSDNAFYKGALNGLFPEKYAEDTTFAKLKTAIAKMAAEYCDRQAFPVEQAITSDNIIISEIIRCPYTWPDSGKCVLVNFAVPVVMKEQYEGYQLLATHLEAMWLRQGSILQEYGFSVYKLFDIDQEMIYWDATIGVVLAIFLMVTIVVTMMIILRKPACLFAMLGKINKPKYAMQEENKEEDYVEAPNQAEFSKFQSCA